MRAYIFDIDGTLSNCEHRLHHIQKEPKDWRAFFSECLNDAPHGHIVELAIALGKLAEIVFVSGRSDECLGDTITWLRTHGLSGAVYMRPAGDHRDDDVLKSELLDQVLADGYQPIMAFDDRDRVVAMWRRRGIPCAQVAPGDF